MSKKKVVIALGHRALGTTMPEQYKATRNTAKAIADLVEAGADVVISHSNAPQVGMIHTAMNEFSKDREDYTQAPMSVCSAIESGICRIRFTECDSCRTLKKRSVSPSMYNYHTGNGRPL